MDSEPLNYVIFNATRRLWISSDIGEESDSFNDAYEFDLDDANRLYTRLDEGDDTYYVLGVMGLPS